MQPLEYELIAKFRLLDKEAQKRVRALIERETEADTLQDRNSGFDFDTWLRDVEDLQQAMRSRRGATPPSTDVVGLLRDIRDGEDE